jgi:hypothetical protein
MIQVQKDSTTHETTIETRIVILEKKLLATMLMVVALTTAIFLIYAIIDSSMNYESGRVHVINYFTIQSNIVIFIWLAALSLYMLTGKKAFKWGMNIYLSTIVTTYILVTGIIYWTILVPMIAKPSVSTWMFSPSNIWLHTTTPIIAFLIQRYIKAKGTETRLRLNLVYFYIYPIIYISMALVYAANDIYLYPMFNLELLGWIGVGVSLVIIAVIFTGIYVVLLRGKNKVS